MEKYVIEVMKSKVSSLKRLINTHIVLTVQVNKTKNKETNTIPFPKEKSTERIIYQYQE